MPQKLPRLVLSIGLIVLSALFALPSVHANTVAKQANPPYPNLTTTSIVYGSTCSVYSDGSGSCGFVQQGTNQFQGNLYTDSQGSDGEFQAYYQSDASPCPQSGVVNCPNGAPDPTIDGSVCCTMFADVALHGKLGGSGSSTTPAGFGTSLIAIEFEVFESSTWQSCGYFNGVYQCNPFPYWKWVQTVIPFECVQQADTSFLGNIGNPPICSGAPAANYVLTAGGRLIYSESPPDGTGHTYLMEVDVLDESFTGQGTPYCDPPDCATSGAFGFSDFFTSGYYANLYDYGFIQQSNPNSPANYFPANNAITNANSVQFVWTPASDPWPPLSYTLQISTTSDFSSGVTTIGIPSTGYPNNNAYTVAMNEGVFYWRVSETAGNGLTSAYSQAYKLTVDRTPPSTPTLISPSNVAVIYSNNQPTLSWNAAIDGGASPTGIAYYVAEISSSSTFASNNLVAYPSSTSIQAPALAPGTWYWRIEAVDNAGNGGAWSATWSFSIADYSVSVNPTSVSIMQTQGAVVNIPLTSLGSFAGTLTISATSNAPRDPNGVQYLYWDFSGCNTTDCQMTTSLTANGSATPTITVFTYSNSPTGTYTVTVTATSGSYSHSAVISVTVTVLSGGGGGGGGGSLAPGALITMLDGSKVAVQNLKVGDKLLGYDPSTGQYGVSTVTSLVTKLADNMLVFNTGTGTPLRADASMTEVFWTKLSDGTMKWLPAPDEKVGYDLWTQNGWVPIESISIAPAGNHTMWDITATMPYFADGYLDPPLPS